MNQLSYLGGSHHVLFLFGRFDCQSRRVSGNLVFICSTPTWHVCVLFPGKKDVFGVLQLVTLRSYGKLPM